MTVQITPIMAEKDAVSASSGNLTVKTWIYDFFYDHEVSNRFLIKHLEIGVGIVLFYVAFVKWIGPNYMKNRKPYNMKNIMIIYNFMNAALSLALAWVLFRVTRDNWHKRCGFRTNDQEMDLVIKFRPLSWAWLLNKYFDLIDTVFFVLRKKDSHVSILNVSHHGGIILLGLIILKFDAFSPCMVIMILLNSLIHVIMYTYYGLAAFGPHMQKYLGWKRYITQMQIGQFVICLLYMAHSFATGCEKMTTYELTIFSFVLLMLVLFLNFYRKNYKKQHQS